MWLDKASEDLDAGDLILKGTLPSYGTVSFHAQQAAEKALTPYAVEARYPTEESPVSRETRRLSE